MFFLSAFLLLLLSLTTQGSTAALRRRAPDGGAYLLDVTFTDSDDYTVPLQIDLSGSKSWINTPNTICRNPGNLPELTGGLCGVTVADSSSCQSTPQAILEYYNSDNAYLWGKSCSTNLALGPVAVDCQELIYADQNWIQPDGVSAGVLGLAYPESFDTGLVQLSPSSGPPTNASATPTATPSTNTSFLANLFHQHDDTTPLQILPIVSLAISRDASGRNNAGSILFGDFFPFNTSLLNSSSLIMMPMSLSNSSSPAGNVYDDASMQYTIPVSSIYATNNGTQSFQINATSTYNMVISTSDIAISLPPSLASAVNSMFIPPGFLAGDNATFHVHCNAVAPRLNFVIKDQPFLINPVDMKRHSSQSLCISSVAAGSDDQYVLGDLFLRNILLGLDFRSNTLSLLPRPYYRS